MGKETLLPEAEIKHYYSFPSAEYRNFSEPLLGYAERPQRAQACLAFIEAVASFAAPEDEGFAAECHRFVQEAYNTDLDEDITSTAIACFDRCLADEMMAEEEQKLLGADKASEYFRAVAYHQRYPKVLLDAMAEVLGYSTERLIIGMPAHLATYAADVPGQQGMLTPTLAFLVPELVNIMSWPHPPIGVPRQVLYRELLRCGVNPLTPKSAGQARMRRPSDLELKYSTYHFGVKIQPIPRKENFFELANRGTRDIDASAAAIPRMQELNQCKLQYKNNWSWYLHESGASCADCQAETSIPTATLFNSGTAANEAAIRALAVHLNGQAAYIHTNWYSENVPTAEKLLTQTEELHSAKALLISTEPTSFYVSAFDQPVAQTTRKFALQAHNNPHQTYHLLLDVTTSPSQFLAQLIEPIDIPSNLTLIKTASLTKHQAGAKGYFFGVACSSCHHLAREIEKEQEAVGGGLLDNQILYFPRPFLWRGESMAMMLDIRDIISEHCLSLSKLRPANTSSITTWSVVPHTYFCFITPPRDFIEDIVQVMQARTDDPAPLHMQAINEHIASVVRRVVGDVARPENSFGVRMGQSFGLADTRIVFQSNISKVGQTKFLLKPPRISPGFLTSLSELLTVGSAILDALDQATPELRRLLHQ